MGFSLSVMSVAAAISVCNFLGLAVTNVNNSNLLATERGSGRIQMVQADRGSGRVTTDQAYRGSGRISDNDQAYRGSGRFTA